MNDLATTLELQRHIRQCIQKVATGPEYSKDLSFEDAYKAMRYVLSDTADPVQVAVYLVGLRMKRETEDENRATLQAIIDHSTIVTANVPEVLDLSDPYDGYARGVPVSTFVPAILASMGVPCVLHGLAQVGPKFGATHHKILQAAGIATQLSPTQAAQQLETIGWTYVDQAQFAPRLHALIPIRQRMVKRQILTTVETLVGPIRGQQHTHCIGGYVHKAYPAIYAALARQAGFSSAAFIRGMEGGVLPSLQQAGKLFYFQQGGELEQLELSPGDVAIQADVRTVPVPEDLPAAPVLAEGVIDTAIHSDALASAAARMGLAALAGEKGLCYDSMVYCTAICLQHLQRYNDLPTAAAAVRAVLDSGQALKIFQSAA